MGTKLVRFARVNNPDMHYAGHYALPSIQASDVVEFMTLTLDVTLKLRPEVRAKLQGGPEEIRLLPNAPQTFTALADIDILQEVKKSSITVKTIDCADQMEINYLASTIDPCT